MPYLRSKNMMDIFKKSYTLVGGFFMKKQQKFVGVYTQIKNNKSKENLDTAIKEVIDFFHLNVDLK